MSYEVPNINGTFPLAGERLGPAWRAGWALMAEAGGWRYASAVILKMVQSGPIQPNTARNLLSQGLKAGLLERRRAGSDEDPTERVQYRIAVNAPFDPLDPVEP